jgi:hypothetical protein
MMTEIGLLWGSYILVVGPFIVAEFYPMSSNQIVGPVLQEIKVTFTKESRAERTRGKLAIIYFRTINYLSHV